MNTRRFPRAIWKSHLDISRYYISRVENGHTIPTPETLGRFARALQVPVFHLVYEEEGPYQPPVHPKSRRSTSEKLSKRDLGLLERFIGLLNQLRDRDKQLLLGLGRRMLKRATCRSPFGEKLGTKYKVGTQRTGASRGMSPSRKGRR